MQITIVFHTLVYKLSDRNFLYYILSDECVSTNLGVTVNHGLVSLASPFYDLALHLRVLSTI